MDDTDKLLTRTTDRIIDLAYQTAEGDETLAVSALLMAAAAIARGAKINLEDFMQGCDAAALDIYELEEAPDDKK